MNWEVKEMLLTFFPLAFLINEELFNIFFNLAFLSTNPTRNFMSKFKELNREGSQPTDDLNLKRIKL